MSKTPFNWHASQAPPPSPSHQWHWGRCFGAEGRGGVVQPACTFPCGGALCAWLEACFLIGCCWRGSEVRRQLPGGQGTYTHDALLSPTCQTLTLPTQYAPRPTISTTDLNISTLFADGTYFLRICSCVEQSRGKVLWRGIGMRRERMGEEERGLNSQKCRLS